MIATIRRKGLEAYYRHGTKKGLPPALVKRIAVILAALDAAESLEELDIPGLRLHHLKGSLKGYWAVSVSGNWRIVFRFQDKAAYGLDLVDYH
ncbi:MAG: type II toxin-antitoxin system RelE/ParE family toxin [Nitrospinae bacterium]|nr:type II toxin-antitoxin system RelE/ParE family toxin [Nitrospinota bacterium]